MLRTQDKLLNFQQFVLGFNLYYQDVLRQVLLSLAHPLTEEGIDELMRKGDRRSEGRLTKSDFIKLMMNRS